jgi:3-methylcrotonyl-CoA carboxylase alpha subunit
MSLPSPPFASVLVANRGEIACRVFRTAKRLGMRTIAVYAEGDRDTLHVAAADIAYPLAESYLDIGRIIATAEAAGAACIHPGYGFLAERVEFAEAAEAAGIAFIGPPAAAIRAMGLKDAAKTLAARAGIPVVPGYHGGRQEAIFLKAEAEKIGYPVLIKPVAGGGGKGMRRVESDVEFEAALESARREAAHAFDDPRVLIEKYVASPRHVEVQIFADRHGHAVSLFERDCSLQRRHQKVIEEAPAPEMRQTMSKAAVDLAQAVGYVGAGTVEFIADGHDGLRPDRFYFMEMNTRLQVEHPVTEAITGLDLVELQFRVAASETLPFRQEDLTIDGHAVEARLYAEDPAAGFLPATGRLQAFRLPDEPHIRVDTGVREGDMVTPFYDPMIAKIIAHGRTRNEALDRLGAALGRTLIAGPRTNLAFLKALVNAEGFRRSHFDTGFIERHLSSLIDTRRDADAIGLGVRALIMPPAGSSPRDPWDLADGFQLGGTRRQRLPMLIDGTRIDIDLIWPGPRIEIDGEPAAEAEDAVVVPTEDGVIVVRHCRQTIVQAFDHFDVDLEHLDAGGIVTAPMSGRITGIFAQAGDKVVKGQRLAVMEAMKMEIALTAPRDGVIREAHATPGAQVTEGARLFVLAEEAHHG